MCIDKPYDFVRVRLHSCSCRRTRPRLTRRGSRARLRWSSWWRPSWTTRRLRGPGLTLSALPTAPTLEPIRPLRVCFPFRHDNRHQRQSQHHHFPEGSTDWRALDTSDALAGSMTSAPTSIPYPPKNHVPGAHIRVSASTGLSRCPPGRQRTRARAGSVVDTYDTQNTTCPALTDRFSGPLECTRARG